MMSIVIDDLRRNLSPGARIAWVSFDPRSWNPGEDIDVSSAVVVTLTLLLCANDSTAISAQVMRLLEIRISEERGTATMADLSEILRLLGAPTSRVFLLFDAVDSVPEDVRPMLMAQLEVLQESFGLNIFATARLSGGIDELFPGKTSLEIRASAEDISGYLGRGLDSDPQLRLLVEDTLNGDLRQNIFQTTVDLSDGMLVEPPFPL
jgi:hypothetical protein